MQSEIGIPGNRAAQPVSYTRQSDRNHVTGIRLATHHGATACSATNVAFGNDKPNPPSISRMHDATPAQRIGAISTVGFGSASSRWALPGDAKAPAADPPPDISRAPQGSSVGADKANSPAAPIIPAVSKRTRPDRLLARNQSSVEAMNALSLSSGNGIDAAKTSHVQQLDWASQDQEDGDFDLPNFETYPLPLHNASRASAASSDRFDESTDETLAEGRTEPHAQRSDTPPHSSSSRGDVIPRSTRRHIHQYDAVFGRLTGGLLVHPTEESGRRTFRK